MAKRNSETREEYNARMNEHGKAKYRRRRNAAIAFLGGKCVDCSSTQRLEFDHKDPKQKSFNLAHRLTSMRQELLDVEIAKCVLRCNSCHQIKTGSQNLESVDILGDLMKGII